MEVMEGRSDFLRILTMITQEIMDVSSSDSDDNAEDLIVQTLNKRRKICRVANYVERIVPGLTAQQFKAHFRSISDRFDVGRSTALYCTRRVVDSLVQLAPSIIKWPNTEEAEEIWAGFEATSGFPKVIGAIDGTHIRIPAPKAYPEAYVNRKGHHSIQLQAICDHRCRFIHCYAGHVGSVHDQRVFRLSEVPTYFNDVGKFPEQCHLVGDSAYKLHPNLLTPYRDNGHLTERQRNYNFCQSSARIAIERAFGLLKGRFRSLLTVLAIDRVERIPKHILACCILHNICLTRDNDLNIEVEEEEALDCNIPENERVRHADDAGLIKRNAIAGQLRVRNV